MQLQDENQLTLIVLKVKGVIASFSCVMISFFWKTKQKKIFQEKKNCKQNKIQEKKIEKICQKGKKIWKISHKIQEKKGWLYLGTVHKKDAKKIVAKG